jgi:hypothetical protein
MAKLGSRSSTDGHVSWISHFSRNEIDCLNCLFNFLVGDGEQPGWHLDAERPRRLKVDDEREFGRLQCSETVQTQMATVVLAIAREKIESIIFSGQLRLSVSAGRGGSARRVSAKGL